MKKKQNDMDSLKLNLEVMDNFIRFINTGDIDLGQSIISPDVVFYASTLFSMLIQLGVIPELQH